MRLQSGNRLKVWRSAVMLLTMSCSVLRGEPSIERPTFSNWIQQFNCSANLSRNKLPTNDGLSAIHLVNCNVPELHANMFGPYPTITTLNIRNSELRTMDETSLNGLRNLESLAITFNHLRALRKFSPHYFNAMDSIDLQSNDIGEITPDALNLYPNVELINLSNNQIVSIPQALFANNSRITSINLSHNRLAHVSADDFLGLERLAELSLNDNQIRNLSQAVFRSNGELIKLRLDGNQLDRLDADVFRLLRRLASVNLSTNALETIEPNTFEQNNEMQHLDLSGNRIQELRPDWTIGLRKLETLNLSNNQLSRLQFLGSLTMSLRSLSLSANILKTIPVDTFASLINLQKLRLDNNQLATLDDQAFSHQHHLQSIDVSNNALSTADFLHPLANLRYLSMANNQFTTINLTLFFHYHEVELSGNPWRCTWLIEEITNVADGINFGRNYSIDGRERHHGELMVPGIDCIDESGLRKGIVLLQMPTHDRNAYSGDEEMSTESAVSQQNKTIRKMLKNEFDYKACLIWVAIAVVGVFGVLHLGKMLFRRSEMSSEKFRLSQQPRLLPSIETTLSIPSSPTRPASSRSPTSTKPSPSFMVRVDDPRASGGTQQSYSRCEDGSE